VALVTDLLTVRDVQDLLKVDRITVYRMLKDGRLAGVKARAQWRFSREEIHAYLRAVAPRGAGLARPQAAQALPLHCAQLIQNVFADVAEVSAITTTPAGEPVTDFSRPCRFCRLILDSKTGRQGCEATWRRIATESVGRPEFSACHAGLQSVGAPVVLDGAPLATLIAGQFYLAPPDPAEAAARVATLARAYHIDAQALSAAEAAVPVLDAEKQRRLPGWLDRMAQTLAELGRERAALLGRLRSIAAMSSIE
jgi:excisionase family DNA binding protein